LKRKKSKTRLLIFIALIALVAAAGLIFALLRRNTTLSVRSQRIHDLLAAADYDISLGYYRKSLESLQKAMGTAQGEYNYLRILKRAYIISDNLEDYCILYKLSRQAQEKIPGSRDLKWIYLYSAIRCELAEQAAWKQLERKTKNQDTQYLQAEAYLRGLLDAAAVPEADLDSQLKRILSLVRQRDPYQLQRLGTELDESRIQLDAAVLWMQEGDAQSAWAIIEGNEEDPLFTEPGIYIAYDAGFEEKALSYLETYPATLDRSDLLIMQGDINLLLGNKSEAIRLYKRVVDAIPGYSWIPYLNLALLTESDGDRGSALEFRRRAFLNFPDSEEVVVSYARSLSLGGKRKSAREIVEQYVEKHPSSYKALLLLLDLKDTASSPALYQAGLWKLYNEHPDSALLCRKLFLYLIELNDLSGAATALRHYESTVQAIKQPWVFDYKARLAALNGDLAAAGELLRKRLEISESWRARYNLALLLSRARQPEQAIEALIAAENSLLSPRQGGVAAAGYDLRQSQAFRSRIRSRIGEQYLALGDQDAARRECEYAIDLDVSNFHAHRILRILEGE